MATVDITAKINALRTETEKNSVSPENVGYLLQLVYDYANSANTLVTEELESLRTAIENIEYADLTSGGTIDGDLYVNGNARIAESLLVQGVSSFSKSVTIHEGLWVHGGSYLYDGLQVAGRASFINSVTIDENLSVGGNITANGNLTVLGEQFSARNVLVNGDAKVLGTLMCVSNFNSNTVTTTAGLDSFRIGSATDPASGWGTYIWSYGNGHGFIQQGSATTGKAFTLKLQPFGGNVGIGWGNNASAQYMLDVNGAIRGIGAIYAGRGLYVGNESGAYGEVRIYDCLGDLLFYANPSPGYIHIKGQFLDVSPVARFADGIQITGSTITDSLTVNGDASVTGSLSIGGVLLETDGYILGEGKTLMFGGDGISVNAIQVLGSILADNAIMYVADITTDALTVNGNTSVAGSLTVNSNTTIGGTLTIGNYVSFNNEFINIGRANASDITVESEYSILLYAPTVYIGFNNQFVLKTDGITINAAATINGNTSVSGNVTVGTHFSIDSQTGDFSGRLYTGAVESKEFTQYEGVFVVTTPEPMELDTDVNIYGLLNVHSPATFGKVTATNVTAQNFSTPDDGTLNVGTALQVVGDDGVTMQNVYVYSGLRVETWAQFKEYVTFNSTLTVNGISHFNRESYLSDMILDPYILADGSLRNGRIFLTQPSLSFLIPGFGFNNPDSGYPYLEIGSADHLDYYEGINIYGRENSILGNLSFGSDETVSILSDGFIGVASWASNQNGLMNIGDYLTVEHGVVAIAGALARLDSKEIIVSGYMFLNDGLHTFSTVNLSEILYIDNTDIAKVCIAGSLLDINTTEVRITSEISAYKNITLRSYTDSTGAEVYSAIRAVTLDQTQNVPIFGFDRNASIDSVPKLVIGDSYSYSYGYYGGVSIIGLTSVAGSLTVSGQLTTSHSLVIGYNATAFESALWAKAEDNSTQRLIALTGDATSARYLEIGDGENSIVDSVIIHGTTEIADGLFAGYIECYDKISMDGKLYVGDIATFYDEAHFSGLLIAESDIWARGDIKLLYHSIISKGVHTALTASWAENGTEICVAGLHDNDSKIILGIGSQSYASSNAPDTIALVTSYETGSIELIGNVYVPQTFRLGGATFTYDATNDRVTCDKDIVTVAPSAA